MKDKNGKVIDKNVLKNKLQDYVKNDQTINMENIKDRTIQSSMLIEAEGSSYDELNQNIKNELN